MCRLPECVCYKYHVIAYIQSLGGFLSRDVPSDQHDWQFPRNSQNHIYLFQFNFHLPASSIKQDGWLVPAVQ